MVYTCSALLSSNPWHSYFYYFSFTKKRETLLFIAAGIKNLPMILCQVSVLTHKHHTQKTEAIDFRFLFYSLTK